MNFKKRSFVCLLLLFLILNPMISAVFAGENQSDSKETELKTITIALDTASVTTNDPHNHRDRNTETVIRMWTDALAQQTPDGAMHLDLAESITWLDELNLEVKLRQDVTFHNGDPMTADDVKFTIERKELDGGMEGKTSPRKGMTGPVEAVKVIDDYTIVITYKVPNDLDMTWGNNTLYGTEIIPKKYIEEVGIEGFLEHPIGVGPFKWVEGILNEYIVLERYEDYYGGLDKLPGEVDRIPALDRIIVRFIPEATTRVAALLAGDVDIIQNVPFDSVQLLESNPNTKVMGQKGTSISAIWFNHNKAPFNDKRFRQAVAYAIDYDLIVEKMLLGFAEPLKGRPFIEPKPSSPYHGAFDDVKSPYDYDPEKAKALLEEIGIDELSLVIDTTTADSEVSQVIAQMLGDVGIDASVRVWEQAVIREEFAKGQRDIFVHRWGISSRMPNWIKRVACTRGNFGNYTDQTIYDLIWPAHTMPYSQEAVDMIIEAYEFAMEELPVISLHVENVLEACRTNVKNFVPHTAGRIFVQRLDIE